MNSAEIFEQAERAFGAGDFQRAARLWSSIANNSDAYFNAGNAYAAVRDYPRAIREYRRAMAGGVREAYLNYGQLMQDLGRRRKAVEAFREGYKKGDTGSGLAYAEVLGNSGHHRRAVSIVRTIRNTAKDLPPEGMTILGANLLAMSCDSDEGIGLLMNALANDPTAGEELVRHLRRCGREELASSLLRQALSEGVRNAAVPLGLLLENLGNQAGAEAAYRAGAGLGDRNSLYNLGTLLTDGGRELEGLLAIAEAAALGDEMAARRLKGPSRDA